MSVDFGFATSNKSVEVTQMKYLLYAVYGVPYCILFFIWSIEYVQDNGVIAYLLFGEIIVALKALLWPLFAFL
jgi:hypothetical protein